MKVSPVRDGRQFCLTDIDGKFPHHSIFNPSARSTGRMDGHAWKVTDESLYIGVTDRTIRRKLDLSAQHT